MLRLLPLLTLLCLVLSTPLAQAAEEGWKLEKDADGIQVYTRAVAGESIREIRAVTEVSARLTSVVAALEDVSAMSQLSDVISEAMVLTQQSATRSQVYSVLKMPWPLDDRDMVNQREVRQDSVTLAVAITSIAAPGAVPPKKGRVRIQKSRQEWRLTPQGGERVRAEMRALTDPNGPIPASVINAMSVGTPFKSMQQLRALVQLPKYRQASREYITEPSR